MKTNKHARYEQTQLGSDTQPVLAQVPDMSLQLTPLEMHRAVRLPEVLRMTGLSRSAWYALLNPRLPTYDQEAPRPFKLGNSDRSPSAWWATSPQATSQTSICRRPTWLLHFGR
jgi:predicted DNA-binding transcriptional regulator AlpA